MTPCASVADFGTQCDLPAICMDEQCVNGRAAINNLRTTVEVLEAEMRNLRETGCGKCGGENGGSKWTVQRGKRRPLKINNSHGRDIAELVQSMVTGDTTVKGTCRPGAKLHTVNSDATPPPDSCYHSENQ
ncbi:hypothetical protein J6590_047856 [Homalodisca vitripennis]|nr:hypothetical protein J6590_047856 [Homalodisca vitripennis]